MGGRLQDGQSGPAVAERDPIDRPSRPLVECSLPTTRGGRVRVASKRSFTDETSALVASQSSRHPLDSEAPADRSGPGRDQRDPRTRSGPTGPAFPIGLRRAGVGGRDGRASASENGRRAGRALYTTICRALPRTLLLFP